MIIWIQRFFSGLVTVGRYGKWHQPTAVCDAAVLGNYDVITSPALGGGVHCRSASS